jgi:hypothetical protein
MKREKINIKQQNMITDVETVIQARIQTGIEATE